MRRTFLALVLATAGGFALASCGNGSGGGDMAAVDMAATKLNCLGVGNCVLQCVVGGQGNINSCFTTCSQQAKTGSASKWAQAFQCGQDYCTGPGDMSYKCVVVMAPTGGSILCDPGVTYDVCKDATTGVCLDCLANARNLILGDFTTNPPGPPTGVCLDPASVDCKGGTMCSAKMDACISDP
jgi:hypothetical protein